MLDEANLELYKTDNGAWEIVSTKVTNHSLQTFGTGVNDSNLMDIYPAIQVTVELRREPAYYVIYLMLPTLILCVLSFFVFLLPTESGEKVSMQVTIILSFLILLMMIAEITPSTGQMPIFCKFKHANMFKETDKYKSIQPS